MLLRRSSRPDYRLHWGGVARERPDNPPTNELEDSLQCIAELAQLYQHGCRLRLCDFQADPAEPFDLGQGMLAENVTSLTQTRKSLSRQLQDLHMSLPFTLCTRMMQVAESLHAAGEVIGAVYAVKEVVAVAEYRFTRSDLGFAHVLEREANLLQAMGHVSDAMAVQLRVCQLRDMAAPGGNDEDKMRGILSIVKLGELQYMVDAFQSAEDSARAALHKQDQEGGHPALMLRGRLLLAAALCANRQPDAAYSELLKALNETLGDEVEHDGAYKSQRFRLLIAQIRVLPHLSDAGMAAEKLPLLAEQVASEQHESMPHSSTKYGRINDGGLYDEAVDALWASACTLGYDACASEMARIVCLCASRHGEQHATVISRSLALSSAEQTARWQAASGAAARDDVLAGLKRDVDTALDGRERGAALQLFSYGDVLAHAQQYDAGFAAMHAAVHGLALAHSKGSAVVRVHQEHLRARQLQWSQRVRACSF